MSFQNSAGKSKISRRWKVDIKETVNDYDFTLTSSHSNGGKCDFCGNNLKYVAVITGNRLDNKIIIQKYNVGFDCLELVFGRNWTDYNKAKSAVKILKAKALAERRKEKYAVKYKDIIDWLNDRHPDFINSNYFLRDMKYILEHGNKEFSKNMESGVRRFMTKPTKLDKDNYEERMKRFRKKTLPKIKKLYDMVCIVDNIPPDVFEYGIPKWSAYKFVRSVYKRASETGFLSPRQKDALNRIHVRYSKKMDRFVVNEDLKKQIEEVPY